MRCVLYPGLRSGEIARLSTDDIGWEAGTIMLRLTKGRREDVSLIKITLHIKPANGSTHLGMRSVAAETGIYKSSVPAALIAPRDRRYGNHPPWHRGRQQPGALEPVLNFVCEA